MRRTVGFLGALATLGVCLLGAPGEALAQAHAPSQPARPAGVPEGEPAPPPPSQPALPAGVPEGEPAPPATPQAIPGPGGPAAAGASPAAPPPAYSMPPSPGERIIRDGFVGGMGLGAGWIGGGGETYRGIAFAATAGFMVTPQIAALADFHLVAKQVTPYASLSHSAAVAAVQVFFADYFWVKAGLGGAWLSASAGSAYETTGARPALLFALGAEPLQTTAGFALDVQLRVMGARYQGPTGRLTASNVSLLLGANWY